MLKHVVHMGKVLSFCSLAGCIKLQNSYVQNTCLFFSLSSRDLNVMKLPTLNLNGFMQYFFLRHFYLMWVPSNQASPSLIFSKLLFSFFSWSSFCMTSFVTCCFHLELCLLSSYLLPLGFSLCWFLNHV